MSDDLFGFSDEFNSFDNDVADDKTLSTEFLAEDENLELAFGDLTNKETALFRLDLIRYLERHVNGGWTPKNLDKLLEEYALLKKTSVPSSRTVADWKKIYYESGRDVASLVPGHSKKGNRKLKNDSSDLVTEAIQTKFLTKERLSVNTAYEYYKYRVIEENRQLTQVKIAPISQRTFYNRVNALPPYEVALARYGKRYADNKFKTVGSIIPATRPMEYVEIDHTTAPVILLDDDLDLPLGRPHLTILYDRYSTCIVGLSVNYRDPSYETVRAAFLNSVLKKDWVKEKYPSIKSEWPCYGKITNLIVDNGAEFWSDVTVGQTIAFVSEDKEMMVGLSFQPYFSVMVNEGLFEISSVCEVPDNAVEVRFVRNQTIWKSFLGSKKRRIKRSMARAELSGVEPSLPETNEERVIDSFHRIPISSGSSGEDYNLFVQKELVSERVAANFNSYGLATNEERRGTVPDLRF